MERHYTRLFFSGQREIATQTDDFIFESSSNICIICNKYFSFENEYDGKPHTMQLRCNHTFCLNCLKRLAQQQINNKDIMEIRCPICSNPLSEIEIDQINKQYNKTLEQRLMQKMNIISCPNCNERFEHVPGDVAYITKDKNGEKIRPEALQCLKENRVTCFFCKTYFCAKCGRHPFHDGLTCSEQSLVEKGIFCRFCKMYPAVGCENEDIGHRVCCRNKCQKLMKTICTCVCHCGHPCCGLKGEKKHFGCPLCNKNLSVCVICNGSCENAPSVLMKCGHPAHKNCLEDFYKLIDCEGRLSIPRCKCQSILNHECVKDSVKKWTEISNKIDSLTSIQIELEETSKEPKHVNNSNDKMYYKQPKKYAKDFFVFYLCKNCQTPYFAGHADEVIDQEHLCVKCKKFPKAPDDLDSREVVNLDKNIQKKILANRKRILSTKIIHLGIRKVYHATSYESALSIMNDQELKKGEKGMFGAGIYFASSKDIADKKCSVHHEVSAFVYCNVDFGNALVLEKARRDLTLEEIREYGCNSVMGRGGNGRNWEFVVYDGKRTHPTKNIRTVSRYNHFKRLQINANIFTC